MKKLIMALVLILSSSVTDSVAASEGKRLQILSGLTQPILLKGGNVALNYTFRSHFVVETSWGFSLDYDSLLTTSEKTKYNSIKSPLTGGFGIGYMPLKNLKLLWEPKFTQFAVQTNTGEDFEYTTYSAGFGMYYDFIIWDRLVIQPAIKYWPRLASTLKRNQRGFIDRDGVAQSHTARSPGNDGFIYNLSIGWAL